MYKMYKINTTTTKVNVRGRGVEGRKTKHNYFSFWDIRRLGGCDADHRRCAKVKKYSLRGVLCANRCNECRLAECRLAAWWSAMPLTTDGSQRARCTAWCEPDMFGRSGKGEGEERAPLAVTAVSLEPACE